MDKSVEILLGLSYLRVRNPSELVYCPNRAFILVKDGDSDVALRPERRDISRDLPWTHTEEVGEVSVGGEASALVIKRIDFDE